MVTTNPFTTANYVEAVEALEKEIKEQADDIERLRKENQTQALDFLASEGEWWELIGKKDKEIERLREALRMMPKTIIDAVDEIEQLREALKIAEAALADIGDADREEGDDLAWCENRAASALPKVRAALKENE